MVRDKCSEICVQKYMVRDKCSEICVQKYMVRNLSSNLSGKHIYGIIDFAHPF